MCIIVAKPAGVDLPSTDTLNNCFTSNRDGIGFAFNLPGEQVTISKGFANVGKLNKMLQTFNVTKEHNLIVHFRLATHGKKDQGNCHPFPLTPDFNEMRYLHCSCDTAIAHNGVFGGMKASEQHSDTMKFIHNILASPEVIANLNSPSVKELIRGYCGFSSKLAFLRPDGLKTIGDFETDGGIYYSNTQYKGWNTHSYQGCQNWKSGAKYCYEHKEYDNCHKTRGGKQWCHRHSAYDECTWCYEHRIYDSCDHDKEESKVKLLDLRNMPCENCKAEEDSAKGIFVFYDNALKSYLCTDCRTVYSQ